MINPNAIALVAFATVIGALAGSALTGLATGLGICIPSLGVATMTREYTNGDAVDIINAEGLGYAVQNYTSGNSFKDPKTARLWDALSNALDELENYLTAETGREID